jgi:hypothetical protein
VHFETFALHLMPPENRQQLIPFQQLFDWFLTEVVGALALWIVLELIVRRSFVVHGICPQQIAKDTVERDFLKSI